MKKIIFLIATTLFILFSFLSFAKETDKPMNAKDIKETLFTYIEATHIGTTDQNIDLFTNDFVYENTINMNKHNKKQYIDFLNKNGGLQFDSETKSEIIDSTEYAAIAKNTLTFNTFTRVDHITMINTKDGWKINKIITSYQ